MDCPLASVRCTVQPLMAADPALTVTVTWKPVPQLLMIWYVAPQAPAGPPVVGGGLVVGGAVVGGRVVGGAVVGGAVVGGGFVVGGGLVPLYATPVASALSTEV